jgi:hypothetical protein
MKRNGNANSNRTYNPRNTKPSIPLDVDEVDAALERFIRQKYDQQLFSGGVSTTKRHNTGSTRSSEDLPPPLPPKPTKRFGFGLRAASSTVTSSKFMPGSPPRSAEALDHYNSPPSPIRLNKQSRVFGASVGSSGENLESKLATLKDMGFPDEKRNLNILKGLGSNLERAIESLVRLGEGGASDSQSRTPMQNSRFSSSQPVLSNTGQSDLVSKVLPRVNGLNPHDPITKAGYTSPEGIHSPPNQSTQNFSSPNPFQFQSLNPFETVPETQPTMNPLEKALGDMQISQPLFPHATGGYPTQYHQLQEARLQQSMTPPVPQLPHQQFQTNLYSQPSYLPNSHHNPFSSAIYTSSTPSTPFLGYQQSLKSPYNPYIGFTNNVGSRMGNPFANGYASGGTGIGALPQQQHQQNQSLHPLLSSNPYGTQLQNPNASVQYTPPQHPTDQLPLHFAQSQRTGRIDKSSILALYNHPQMAPMPPPGTNDGTAASSTGFAPPTNELSPILAGGTSTKPVQRSVTMPLHLSSGSRNPFHNPSTSNGPLIGSPLTHGASMSRHVSQESVDIGGVQNGRHSPDAFASLSARIVR